MEFINLVATNISFNFGTIVYDVKLEKELPNDFKGITISSSDIFKKDLVLKPTVIDELNMKVVFSIDTMTPHFYEAIENKVIKDYEELQYELKKIYAVGDVVAVALITQY